MLSFLLFVASLAVAAPPGHVAANGPVAMTVDGNAVTDAMLAAKFSQVPEEQVAELKASGQWDEVLDSLALSEALYHRAIAAKIHEKPELQVAIAMEMRDVLANFMVESYLADALTEAKLKEAYDARSTEFAGEQVKARHILVKTEAEASNIIVELAAGGDFAKIAAEKSVGPSGTRGGDLGWFGKGQMVPVFEVACFGNPVGVIGAPVSSDFGFHVIEVLEKRDKVPFADVEADLRAELEGELAKAYIDTVKAEMKVEKTKPASAAQ